jgi:type IV pilus assembly protein PilE
MRTQELPATSRDAGPPGDGFTLIELLCAIAIATILIVIAVPSWQAVMQRNHRASVQALMTEVAGRQQQFLYDRRAFATSLGQLGVEVPLAVSRHYDVEIDAPDALPPQFAIIARPKHSQASDSCGELRLDQSGARSPQDCW